MFILLVLMTFFDHLSPNTKPLPHALYLSVVQIDHHDPDADAQVLVKVFSDDLRDVIRAAYPDEFHLVQPATFCADNRVSIEHYFRAKFNCEVNGAGTELSFLSGQLENDVYWLHFKLRVPDQWRSISVRAVHFMEIFSSQSNIIQVQHRSDRRFGRLTRENDTVNFAF